jgi:Rod binding domain-containing protein
MASAVQNAGDLAITQAMGPSLMSRFVRKPEGQTADKAAKDFEGMFMAQMLQPMFNTVGVDKLFGGGHGEEAMRGFLIQEYGKALAKNSHFGIAEAVQSEMQRVQDKKTAANQTSGNAANGAVNAVRSLQ